MLTLIILTESAFYPEQILLSMETSSTILGDMTDINQELAISDSAPIVVDAIRRIVYWYRHSLDSVYSQSLHSGSQQVVIMHLYHPCLK